MKKADVWRCNIISLIIAVIIIIVSVIINSHHQDDARAGELNQQQSNRCTAAFSAQFNFVLTALKKSFSGFPTLDKLVTGDHYTQFLLDLNSERGVSDERSKHKI